ncbi:UNVERIFIED_CONTAM: Retrovirus-related Pol polyprotein from transposon TNT 1-94 [Sesamum angustifolium]|uniref:Retrovirus-related Pol polyprotein from transposon TNT 1-94 n=1 Tax=Sesamum angustifolium TaxID=2727405 RepID=A0AAW2K6T7_9LAMI
MSDTLFDIYQNVESAKALWDTLEAKYMAEDDSSKKFVEELSLVQLGSHLRIEESLRAQENDKPKGKDVVGSSSVNMVEDRRATKTNDKKGTRKDDDVAWWIDSVLLPMHAKIVTCSRGGEHIDPSYFQYVGIIHETTAPYTPRKNGVFERKNRILKEMVNSMLSYSGLSGRFWGEAMLTACYLLNRVSNKRNKVTPYELWYKKKPNLNYLRIWGCRAVVRLPEPKKKSLGERGIDYIFIGYAEHSKAYRFYVIEPNDFISVNIAIESRNAIFDETRFSSIPRPKKMIPRTNGIHKQTESSEMTPDELVELRKSKRKGKLKSFGPDFHLYLIEGSIDEVSTLYPYYFNVENGPKTFDDAMKSQDVAFWKEAINDEMDSIMGNNTFVLVDLPPGCKPLGCK